MKKFGTPIGAGPGSAKENVGLAGVGTPAEVVVGGVLGAGLWGAAWAGEPAETVMAPAAPPLLAPAEVEGPWCAPFLPAPEGLDGCEAEVEVEVVGGLEELGVVEVWLVVVVGSGEVDVLLGTQEAETLFTGPMLGGTSAEVGVPGGALTVKVIVVPLSSVTVTVHSSAEAAGIDATPSVSRMDPSAAAAILSFRPLNTLG